MKKVNTAVYLLLALLSLSSESASKEKLLTLPEVLESFKPLPKQAIDPVKYRSLISLGRDLYFEEKLSLNNKISCNTCHRLDNYGVDNEVTSLGHEGKRGDRNSPSTFNSSLHFSQFWDGRAKDVEEQAVGPILNPVEMGMKSEADVVAKISTEKKYINSFQKAFPKQKKPITLGNIGAAIGAFEKTLITHSRFDKFLEGNMKVLTVQEQRGMKKFVEIGCTSCHGGALLGGDSFQTLGAVNAYDTKDLGRFSITKDEDDKKSFKVPSLRNVLKTAPYFHDGSISTVDEAIRLMAFHQLGEKVDAEFIKDVKAFFNTLTTDKKF